MKSPAQTSPTPARPQERGQSAFSASMLLGASSLLSAVLGLARGKFIAHVFGAGLQTDAYNAAFRLPDLMNNFLVGGAVSITFVTLLNRFRERGEEEEGERLLFTVVNGMMLVLSVASLVLMFAASPFIHKTNVGFTAEQIRQGAMMTRILLPGQIFLFAGGALGSLMLVRKQFLYQAMQPILYNLFIIGFGVLLHKRLGVYALPVGATCGLLVGSLGMSALGMWRCGVRFRFTIDLQHPGLRDWAHMTLPLMLGFGLPFLDQYFWGYYASQSVGDITRLTNAKQLFSAPMSMLAQAAGVAAMPFFAQLWARDKKYTFAMGIADSVSRVVSLGLLAASAMMALSGPIVGLIFGGGRFTPDDVHRTAVYFALFTLSLCFWSAQSIYARAFYAAGITWMPMLASTVILFVAFPLYRYGYFHWEAAGLALASDAGIALQAVVLGLLLHAKRMVSLASLDAREMRRCLIASIAAGATVWLLFDKFFGLAAPHMGEFFAQPSRPLDLALLGAGTLVWVLVANAALTRLGSALPRVMRKRLRLG